MKYPQFLSGKVIHILLLVCLILSACNQTSTDLPTPASTVIPTRPSSTETAPPTPSPTQNPTPFPTFSSETAKTTLVGGFHQLANAFPFRITETDRGLADVTHVTTDYAAADRYHSITSRDSSPNQDETITIGTKTWWKIKGKWDPTPSGNLSQNNFWDLLPKAHDVAYTGQDTVNGVQCFVFSFKLDVQAPGLYLSGSGQAWVGVSDGLPRQFEFSPGANTTGGPTHQVYTYGIAVDIQQPAP